MQDKVVPSSVDVSGGEDEASVSPIQPSEDGHQRAMFSRSGIRGMGLRGRWYGKGKTDWEEGFGGSNIKKLEELQERVYKPLGAMLAWIPWERWREHTVLMTRNSIALFRGRSERK